MLFLHSSLRRRRPAVYFPGKKSPLKAGRLRRQSCPLPHDTDDIGLQLSTPLSSLQTPTLTLVPLHDLRSLPAHQHAKDGNSTAKSQLSPLWILSCPSVEGVFPGCPRLGVERSTEHLCRGIWHYDDHQKCVNTPGFWPNNSTSRNRSSLEQIVTDVFKYLLFSPQQGVLLWGNCWANCFSVGGNLREGEIPFIQWHAL